MDEFSLALSKSDFLVGHNISFDINIIFSEYFRINENSEIEKKGNKILFVEKKEKTWKTLDTMDENSAKYCEIIGGRYGEC